MSFNENFKRASLHFYCLFNFIVLNTAVYLQSAIYIMFVGSPTYNYNIQRSKELKTYK